MVGIALWVRDLHQFAAVNAVFTSRLTNSREPPIRACVEAGLPEKWPVLLEATAHRTPPCLSESGEDTERPRHALHVQSLSHWAPASIGPYSQAVRVSNEQTNKSSYQYSLLLYCSIIFFTCSHLEARGNKLYVDRLAMWCRLQDRLL